MQRLLFNQELKIKDAGQRRKGKIKGEQGVIRLFAKGVFMEKDRRIQAREKTKVPILYAKELKENIARFMVGNVI